MLGENHLYNVMFVQTGKLLSPSIRTVFYRSLQFIKGIFYNYSRDFVDHMTNNEEQQDDLCLCWVELNEIVTFSPACMSLTIRCIM